MIHSFSAADLTIPDHCGPVAGERGIRLLRSVQNRTWPAFRPPGLVTELVAADVPLVAALRQSEGEPFGFPWRLIYLGDPLYRVGPESRDQASLPIEAKKAGSKSPEQRAADWNWWGSRNAGPNVPASFAEGRIDAIAWAKAAAPHDMADMVPIVAMGEMTNRPAVATEDGYDAEKLRLCLDSAIEEAAATHAGKPAAEGLGRRTTSQGQHGSDWRTLLRRIRRERLEEGLRNVHDELLIDALCSGRGT